jgi:hypothetical protein
MELADFRKGIHVLWHRVDTFVLQLHMDLLKKANEN